MTALPFIVILKISNDEGNPLYGGETSGFDPHLLLFIPYCSLIAAVFYFQKTYRNVSFFFFISVLE